MQALLTVARSCQQQTSELGAIRVSEHERSHSRDTPDAVASPREFGYPALIQLLKHKQLWPPDIPR